MVILKPRPLGGLKHAMLQAIITLTPKLISSRAPLRLHNIIHNQYNSP